MFGLSGKHILITGASSGIGRAAAQQFASAGARILALGRNEDRLSETISLCPGSGHQFAVLDLDHSELIVPKLKALAGQFGLFNGVFHSAGEALVLPVSLVKPDAIDSIFAPTITAALMISKAFIGRGVRADGPTSVVMMSSVSANVGQLGLSVYSASKGAISSAVRSLACEGAEKQIRFNSIVAGAIQTEMHDRLTQNLGEDSVKNYEKMHLLGFGQAQDVAMAAQYLLSDAAKWITGTELVVDGGYLCR